MHHYGGRDLCTGNLSLEGVFTIQFCSTVHGLLGVYVGGGGGGWRAQGGGELRRDPSSALEVAACKTNKELRRDPN